jgi:hypothetical protein
MTDPAGPTDRLMSLPAGCPVLLELAVAEQSLVAIAPIRLSAGLVGWASPPAAPTFVVPAPIA